MAAVSQCQGDYLAEEGKSQPNQNLLYLILSPIVDTKVTGGLSMDGNEDSQHCKN